jgi:hypothetical protein
MPRSGRWPRGSDEFSECQQAGFGFVARSESGRLASAFPELLSCKLALVELLDSHRISLKRNQHRRISMKLALIVVTAAALATPAFADDVGVGVSVGPVGAGATVGEHRDYGRDRDHTTVIKEREPTDRTTVIKKENEDGTRSKTVIHDHDHD